MKPLSLEEVVQMLVGEQKRSIDFLFMSFYETQQPRKGFIDARFSPGIPNITTL